MHKEFAIKSVIHTLITGPLSVNTYIVSVENKGVFIVDPGGNTEAICAYIDTHCIVPQKPLALILTHGHFDHLIAVPALHKNYPEMPIYIHEDDSSYLGEQGLASHMRDFALFGAESLVKTLGLPMPPATHFMQEGEVLFVSSCGSWRVLHTPGHSPGSVCLYNEDESILIAGDTVFKQGIGRTDLPNGSLFSLEKSLERLAQLPPHTRVLCGHGEESTIGNEFA